jgi:hypothetical protein
VTQSAAETCRSCGVAVESGALICAACRLSLAPAAPAFKFTIANPLFWSLALVAFAVGSVGWYLIFAARAWSAQVVSAAVLGNVASVAALYFAADLFAPHRVISQLAFIVNLALAALTLCLMMLMTAFPA